LEKIVSEFSDTMPKAKTSFVWNHFLDITRNPTASGERVRKCKMCPYIYKSKSKTMTAMVNHLRSSHNIVHEASDSDVAEETESITAFRHLFWQFYKYLRKVSD
jgi:hypothetical protein